ncbi:putative uncharacterized phage protein [Aliivibrio wodanis]|uniref:Uncharacterized phage protein n=1 Tax=Aliivibrio wodanis TaxID=80852 RepID=A0A090I9S8_9GAMM|nr:putative uncharacterized phage protein [Aliivibrio wodanis]
MQGTIIKQIDDITVLVSYKKNDKQMERVMRLSNINCLRNQDLKGAKVSFSLDNVDAYGRLLF